MMMLDRILSIFHRSPDGERAHACDESDRDKARARRELERREIEARRMNDALEGIVATMQDHK
jgi:hypothetical protein